MRVRSLLVAFVLALVAPACSGVGPGGGKVGARCNTDRECDTKCFMSDKFGGGFCSQPCASDAECPQDTACISTNGGMCAILCTAVSTCGDFGLNWFCSDEDRETGGKVGVCRAPPSSP